MSARPGYGPRVAARPAALGPAAQVLVTSRHGGVSGPPFATLNLSGAVGDDPAAVAANRELLQSAVTAATPHGRGPRQLAWMRQVHGRTVAYVGEPGGNRPVVAVGLAQSGTAGQAPVADAIFTGTPEIALGVLVADCAPVLIADAAAGLVGAAHAGRAGLAAGVLEALVRAMTRAGADPARMRAAIGPAICGRCYQVPREMQAEVAAVVAESACQTRSGAAGIDISGGLRAQLGRLGVPAVSADRRCTAESEDLFSYRRDGETGRFAALIWLAPWQA